jgi:hypothetical protein
MPAPFFPRLLRVWPVIALTDGLFATALSVLAYHSTATRLWQGVASTVLGPGAIDGGARPVFVGILLHLGVALFWSAVFLALLDSSSRLRRVLESPAGMLAVAAVYGPLVWMVMSLAVIPTLTGRPPSIAARWWVQLVGHVFFVALPIVVMSARGLTRGRAAAPRPAVGTA